MPDRRPHARQRRPGPTVRGWVSPREYAEARSRSLRTVQHWCQQGRVFDRLGRAVPVEGGDGRDYRIPLAALA